MAGTTVNTIDVYPDGKYITQIVGTAAIVLGSCVAIDASNADTVLTGTDTLKNVSLGVALSARRFSRTQTDDEVAVGEKLTVMVRGVARVTCTGTVTRGEMVQTGDAGVVVTHSPGSATYDEALG